VAVESQVDPVVPIILPRTRQVKGVGYYLGKLIQVEVLQR
jgi:hypothetical protein